MLPHAKPSFLVFNPSHALLTVNEPRVINPLYFTYEKNYKYLFL